MSKVVFSGDLIELTAERNRQITAGGVGAETIKVTLKERSISTLPGLSLILSDQERAELAAFLGAKP